MWSVRPSFPPQSAAAAIGCCFIWRLHGFIAARWPTSIGLFGAEHITAGSAFHTMINRRIILAILSFLLPGSSNSFFVPFPQTSPSRLRAEAASWSPQDLTANNDGFTPVPDDDYIKQYQQNPKLWPVEFFVIAHRRNGDTGQTEILVRRSANGTSKYGLGTGVPATRWILSTSSPPMGYEWSEDDDNGHPTIFPASGYPEYDAKSCNNEDWIYRKIDIREDAFRCDDADLRDSELEKYAATIREALRQRILEQRESGALSSWETARLSVIQNVLDRQNSIAAIQGSLRMNGLLAERSSGEKRYLNLDDMPDSLDLAKSMRIYTMFPQMPDPMPHPSSTPQELKVEIETRPSRMAENGRNPHMDQYGRIYTHISTTNVSNTIHGIYLSLDVTDLPGLDDVPAFDLFGTRKIAREWVSLENLKVLAEDGTIGLEDTKPTFISGFIVRQLVKEGIVSP